MEQDNNNTQSFVPLTKGTEVGHYRIVEKIGAGGMGEVYLAEDSKLKRNVALKFMPLQYMNDDALRQRFTREARAVAALSHPNIVTIHEVDEFKGRPFFAMEHVKGESLRDVIKKGKLGTEEAVSYTMQICEGLQEAHEAGIIHRDVKPGNIIIDSKGRARILDFGLAMVTGEEKITKTGSTLGTVGYMSPEQIEGKKVDQRSDIFSVGVMLYEMVTGRRPFEGDNDAAIVKAITSSSPEPIARFKSGVTGQLQSIIDKALVKDASLRYQHSDGMLADLKRLQTETAPYKKGKIGWWVAAAAVLIAITGYFLLDQFVFHKEGGKTDWAKSIAVLVFRDQSPNKDQDYFCEGMTDAIIGRLSGIQNLKVISLTSVLRFKEPERDLKKIGEMLGVETILEGSIQKEKDRIRVRAQLIDVKEDAHLWSDQYDHKLESVFDVQDSISKAIVDVMKIELMGDDESTLVKRNTENLEAYNEYTQGRYFWRKRTAEGIRKSIEHFERAIELDSTYALAFSGLADAWSVLPGYSNVSSAETEQKAVEAARTAVQLDDNLAEAHASLGLAVWYSILDVELGEKEFKRAIEINPGYAWSRIWYGNLLEQWMKDRDGKKRQLELALESDPLSIVALNNLASMNSEDSLFDEAERLFYRLIEIEPANAWFRVNFALHFIRAGKIEDANIQFEKAMELGPTLWDLYYNYTNDLFNSNYKDEAEKIWHRAISEHPDQPEIYELYGRFLRENAKKPNDAIKQFEKAISFDANSAFAFEGLAKSNDDIKMFDKAISAAVQAVKLKPDEPELHKTLAETYYHAGKLDSSVNSYLAFLGFKPGHNAAIRDAGLIAILARQYDLADSLFAVMEKHVIASERAWGRLHKARVLIHQGKFNKALEDFAAGIEIDRQEIGDDWPQLEKIYQRGLIFLLQEKPDSAVVQFREARQMVQRIDSTHHWNVITQGRIAEALAIAGEEIKARDTLKNCWATMDTTKSGSVNTFKFYNALMEYNLGNYDSALAVLEKRSLDNFTIKVTIGSIRLAAGQTEKAVSHLEEAMSEYTVNRFYHPERSVMGHYYLAQAYEAAGRTNDAIEQYETFLDIWKNADEGLRPVEDARARLTRLKNKS